MCFWGCNTVRDFDYYAMNMRLRLLQLSCAFTLVSAGICPAQSADLRSKINDALDMARPALINHLKASVRSSQRVGELSLLVLAGIHDGIVVSDRTLAAAINKLAKAKPTETYDIALRLIVLEACPTFPNRSQVAKRDLAKLLDHRGAQGLFQYREHPATWDLSNTQYGVLGLRAARGMGMTIPRNTWSKIARAIGAQQGSYGGFGYTKRSGKDATPSMTVAGIAVLAICRQALGDNYARSATMAKQINRGWLWMDLHKESIGSVTERWSYYFHYGLERAAILCGVEKVGSVDWYAAGARMLVAEQLPGGGWRSLQDGFPGAHLSNGQGDSVPTSFAILFLRRQFQKQSRPITPRIVRLVNIGPFSKQKDIDACVKNLARRGKAAMPDVLNAMRSDVEPQRQVAKQALLAITGDDFGYDEAKDRDANRRAIRDATKWYLRNR